MLWHPHVLLNEVTNLPPASALTDASCSEQRGNGSELEEERKPAGRDAGPWGVEVAAEESRGERAVTASHLLSC